MYCSVLLGFLHDNAKKISLLRLRRCKKMLVAFFLHSEFDDLMKIDNVLEKVAPVVCFKIEKNSLSNRKSVRSGGFQMAGKFHQKLCLKPIN